MTTLNLGNLPRTCAGASCSKRPLPRAVRWLQHRCSPLLHLRRKKPLGRPPRLFQSCSTSMEPNTRYRLIRAPRCSMHFASTCS
jgi:hypothetical protein